MKVLITGCHGTVGSNLSHLLREAGHEVFGVDLIHAPGEVGWTQTMEESLPTYARCDISEYHQLDRIFERFGPFEIVYNTAAEFGRWNGEDYYEQLWRTNVIGTKHLIRIQEKRGFRLIHFSSSEVYGDFDGIMSEDVMDRVEIPQLNDYALSKWVNEQQIRNSQVLRGTESVVVRLFNTYGPGEFYHPYRSVNCKFVYSALKGLPATVFRGHFRTSTYLDDCCQTLARIAETFIPSAVYNIGSRDYHSIEELADTIWDIVGADRKLLSYRESEFLTTKSKVVDISRAEAELNHKNHTGLREGLAKTVSWMSQVLDEDLRHP